MAYEDHRNPAFPWGYWLTARSVRGLAGRIGDDDGTSWDSVREALWCGRLGMGRVEEGAMETYLEALAGVLVIHHRRSIVRTELHHDVEGGDRFLGGFYRSWLEGHGLIVADRHGDGKLTPEGRAVLLMLGATRPARFGPLPLGPDAPPSSGRPGADRAATEAWLTEISCFAARLPYRFERTGIGTQHAILLYGDQLGHRMPMRRVLWSLTLADEAIRDGLFTWLAMRIERWGAWGERAWTQGAAAFTQHLLALIAAGLPETGRVAPPLLALASPTKEETQGR